MEDFKDLRVWEKAHELTLCVYKKNRVFPREEIYWLTSQLRRPASSVGANIAEGNGAEVRYRRLRRFLQIARGSANEVEHHLLLARNLQFMSVDDFPELEAIVLEIQRMLASRVQRLSVDILARGW